MSWPRLTNFLIASFLLGVMLHSAFPYEHMSWGWMFVSVVMLLGVGAYTSSVYRQFTFLLLAFALGLLRFSFAQPSLPRGLIFANPKGLAMSVDPPHTANHFDPRHWLSRARVAFTALAYEQLSRDEAALLTGLLYGAHDLSKTDKLAFRHAGLTHVIAVSGANMTIIVVFVMRLLLVARLSRRHAFVVCVLAVTAFTLFVGPSASVIRAALMGILVELAPLVGRLVRPTRILLISAFIFVLWHPASLIFDPSFALSFLAMLGLLTWGRWFDGRLSRQIFSTTLREIIASTLSATLMTAPYAAWAFGNGTLWGLLTGVFVLPIIPWTMALGSLTLVAPKFIAKWIALPTKGLLESILWIARTPDHVGMGFFDHATLTFSTLCACYVAIYVMWHTRDREKVSTSNRD